MKPVRELRDEITEHVAGRWKAMQQQNRWSVLRPRLPIEDFDAVDIDLAEADSAQGKSFPSM